MPFVQFRSSRQSCLSVYAIKDYVRTRIVTHTPQKVQYISGIELSRGCDATKSALQLESYGVHLIRHHLVIKGHISVIYERHADYGQKRHGYKQGDYHQDVYVPLEIILFEKQRPAFLVRKRQHYETEQQGEKYEEYDFGPWRQECSGNDDEFIFVDRHYEIQVSLFPERKLPLSIELIPITCGELGRIRETSSQILSFTSLIHSIGIDGWDVPAYSRIQKHT